MTSTTAPAPVALNLPALERRIFDAFPGAHYQLSFDGYETEYRYILRGQVVFGFDWKRDRVSLPGSVSENDHADAQVYWPEERVNLWLEEVLAGGPLAACDFGAEWLEDFFDD